MIDGQISDWNNDRENFKFLNRAMSDQFKTGYMIMILKKVLVLISFSFLLLYCNNTSNLLDLEIHANGAWEKIRESADDEFYNAIFFIDKHNGWAVGNSVTIIDTKDGGETWDYQNSGVNSSIIGINFC